MFAKVFLFVVVVAGGGGGGGGDDVVVVVRISLLVSHTQIHTHSLCL